MRIAGYMTVVVGLISILLMSCGKDQSSNTSSSTNPPQSGKYPRIMEAIKSDETNIVFFGKVVDQENHPVAEAVVHVGYRHYDPKIGLETSDASFQSGDDGIFTVKGIRGHKLFIELIDKDGYEYNRAQNPNTIFEYRPSPTELFRADPDAPVVFVVRKRNPPALVIPTGLDAPRLEYKKRYYYHIASERHWMDGEKTVEIKGVVPDITMIVECIVDRENYRVKLTIASATEGCRVQFGDQMYTAPSEGYKETDTSGFVDHGQTVFVYVQQSGPVYRRLDVKIIPHADLAILHIRSWTNPTGDRNLEYDEAIYKEYLKKQEDERKKRRTLVIPMKSRMELRYGTIYYYNVLAAKYWDEGHRPDNMTPDIKIVTTLSEENGKDKAKFIISAVAKGDQVLVGEKMDIAPADDYKDIGEFEYINRPIYAGYMGYVYLKQKGPIYSRLDFYGSVDVDMARFSISSWTNPTGDRNLEYDEAIYKEYLKKKEEEEKRHK